MAAQMPTGWFSANSPLGGAIGASVPNFTANVGQIPTGLTDQAMGGAIGASPGGAMYGVAPHGPSTMLPWNTDPRLWAQQAAQNVPGLMSQGYGAVVPSTVRSLGALMRFGRSSATAAPQLSQQMQQMQQMVTMRAPTGEVQAVPAQHVAMLEAKGAVRV